MRLRRSKFASLEARVLGPVLVGALGLIIPACGGPPALQNVPRPNPAVVAGAAAAVAGAATLADPNGAAAKAESNQPTKEPRPVKVKDSVPPDVLDRLDAAEADDAHDDAAAAPPTKPDPDAPARPRDDGLTPLP
ncbi:MAG: hypothetical protein H6709_24350 [Kofleriaceae bacterium]|nr:hypothetical protein [Kofleriaceae bacterium]MCB9575221.1 hypothetical protein [Kofleriaceae bacterium]